MSSSSSSSSAGGSVPVVLRVYDLSRGMAASLSPMVLGERIEGIWHTGVYVYGREYFYGGSNTTDANESGISSTPGRNFSAMNGMEPVREINLGNTSKTQADFEEFLVKIGPSFRTRDYRLMEHNCNNFSDRVSRFLVSKPIPGYITGLPARVLGTPRGQALKPFLDGFNNDFQAQLASPAVQSHVQHYGPTSTASAAFNTASSDLDAALASLGQPMPGTGPAAAAAATTATTMHPASDSLPIDPVATLDIPSQVRRSCCRLTVFHDMSVLAGMVRRLTNLAPKLGKRHPEYLNTLKQGFVALQRFTQVKTAPPRVDPVLSPLAKLCHLLDKLLKAGEPRAILPALYLTRQLCLFRGLFHAIVRETRLSDWLVASLAPGDTTGPLSQSTARMSRTLAATALANLCSHPAANADGGPVSVVKSLLARATEGLRGSQVIARQAQRALLAGSHTPSTGAGDDAEAERFSYLALLGNAAIQLSSASATQITDSAFQALTAQIALDLFPATTSPLTFEEQASNAAGALDQGPPPNALFFPAGVRRQATETATELLKCSSLHRQGTAELQQLRRVIKSGNLVLAARGNARRMLAAAHEATIPNGQDPAAMKAELQRVSGAFFVSLQQVMTP